MKPIQLKIMMVAGEASGDAHGAKLVKALVNAESGAKISFFGAAGPKMRDAGVEPTVMADELSVVGLAEIAGALPMFLRAMKSLKRSAAENKPDVAVLIDFPDFNLKLAKSLKKAGIPVVYYISPQLWAWRGYRIKSIAKYVDRLLTILPFEKDWYEQRGVTNVEFVGNPLAFEVHPSRSKEEFCNTHGLDASLPIVSLLPGSRSKEIVRILPVLLECAAEMNRNQREIQFLVAMANDRHRQMVTEQVAKLRSEHPPFDAKLLVVEGETYDALATSDAAAVTSGTATLECGIIGTPMAIVYKTSKLNYTLLKPMISVDHYGLVNLIAGKRLVKEIIQDELTASSLSDEIIRLLEPVTNARMRVDLAETTEKLGRGGASQRAAAAILDLVSCPS